MKKSTSVSQRYVKVDIPNLQIIFYQEEEDSHFYNFFWVSNHWTLLLGEVPSKSKVGDAGLHRLIQSGPRNWVFENALKIPHLSSK